MNCSRLRHPNVLLFMGACIEPPNFSIVTEYMKHGCAASLLQNRSIELTWLQRLRMVREAALGMAYLHGMNPPLIHRDLTSFNILVCLLLFSSSILVFVLIKNKQQTKKKKGGQELAHKDRRLWTQ